VKQVFSVRHAFSFFVKGMKQLYDLYPKNERDTLGENETKSPKFLLTTIVDKKLVLIRPL